MAARIAVAAGASVRWHGAALERGLQPALLHPGGSGIVRGDRRGAVGPGAGCVAGKWGCVMRKRVGALVAAVAGVVAWAAVAYAVAPDVKPKAARPVADSVGVTWPMPVDAFLAGKYLERSDVVLTRRDGDAASYLIRWATGSIFSHAALVFTGPQFEQGYTGTFVIEAGTGGVDLTNLRDYAADKSSFIAIKRFRSPWFDQPKQSRVRGVLLDKIKAGYNYWAIGRIARNIWFGVQQKIEGKEKTIERYRNREWTPPQEFICSGLVQLGFVEATLEYIRAGQLPASALKEVVFHREASSRLPEVADWRYFDTAQSRETAELFRELNRYDLESVTPEDLARSEKLDWLYFIKGGQVYTVASYDEAKQLAK